MGDQRRRGTRGHAATTMDREAHQLHRRARVGYSLCLLRRAGARDRHNACRRTECWHTTDAKKRFALLRCQSHHLLQRRSGGHLYRRRHCALHSSFRAKPGTAGIRATPPESPRYLHRPLHFIRRALRGGSRGRRPGANRMVDSEPTRIGSAPRSPGRRNGVGLPSRFATRDQRGRRLHHSEVGDRFCGATFWRWGVHGREGSCRAQRLRHARRDGGSVRRAVVGHCTRRGRGRDLRAKWARGRRSRFAR